MAADLNRLRSVLADLENVVVAFSGGVDSGLLAWAAADALGPRRALAVTAVSASLAPEELADCRRMADDWSMPWATVDTDELAEPAYVANGADRCYHCKSALMDRLVPVAVERGAVVVLGVNLDDLDDHRPGQRAARERGARFPLVEAGFTKADVREEARRVGLDVWDKPAAACLSSRLPYGTPVTVGRLARVAAAESGLRRLGYRAIRVRHYGDLARIELDGDELGRAVSEREAVIAAVRAAGYRYVTLDLEGLRSGNLNASLRSSS